MKHYDPELMYALDSKSEYSDWKNVYNVSGSDVLYLSAHERKTFYVKKTIRRKLYK